MDAWRAAASLTVVVAAGVGLGEGLSGLLPDLPRWGLNIMGLGLSVLLIHEIGRRQK